MNPKFQKAISLFKKKDFDEAKNICEEILEIEPKNFDVLHLYGIIYFQTKNYDLAAKLISKAVKINSNKKKPRKLNLKPNLLEEYCGVRKFDFGEADEKDRVGQVTGLAWTQVGGELLTLEAASFDGKGKIIKTISYYEYLIKDAYKELIYLESLFIRIYKILYIDIDD